MNFYKNLKRIRKSKKISQTEIAKVLDVSQRTISHYENGTCEPSLTGLCKIAEIMEVTLDELVGFTLVKKQPNEF